MDPMDLESRIKRHWSQVAWPQTLIPDAMLFFEEVRNSSTDQDLILLQKLAKLSQQLFGSLPHTSSNEEPESSTRGRSRF